MVQFRRAKLWQDARLAGVAIEDTARALARMAGPKAIADFDLGLTGGYINKAEALLELATKYAQQRRSHD